MWSGWVQSKASVPFLLHTCPEYIFERYAGEYGPRGIIDRKSRLSRVAQVTRSCIEQQQRAVGETERALVEETSSNECISEKGPTTLWGILELVHPSRKSESIPSAADFGTRGTDQPLE